jgi:hypothetical protein
MNPKTLINGIILGVLLWVAIGYGIWGVIKWVKFG